VTDRIRLKICGTTNIEDAGLIGSSGADFCGILVDVDYSERNLTLSKAVKVAAASGIANVILMCNPDIDAAVAAINEINPYAIQLLDRETPDFVSLLKSRVSCRVWKSLHLPPIPGQYGPFEYLQAGIDAFIVDRADASDGFLRLGGTGLVADWQAASELVRAVSKPVFLAGGITPENVARAVAEVGPYGIDLCSGVEAVRGKKDPAKIRALIDEIRQAMMITKGNMK
jgi:phosphoribosylanthranilate isomerase